MLISLARVWLRARSPLHLLVKGVDRAPEIGQLEPGMTSAFAIGALRCVVWFSGWRVGKFMRPLRSITGACRVSASSIKPFDARGGARHAVRRPAPDSRRPPASVAASVTAPESPMGGGPSSAWGRASWRLADRIFLQLAVGDDHHRAIGGVIAIL